MQPARLKPFQKPAYLLVLKNDSLRWVLKGCQDKGAKLAFRKAGKPVYFRYTYVIGKAQVLSRSLLLDSKLQKLPINSLDIRNILD
jgi:hypothetical protein